jgi:hypothetical protein
VTSWIEWGLGFALLAGTLVLGALLVVKIVVIGALGCWPLLWFVIESWRTILLAVLAIALVVAWGRRPDLPSLAELRRHHTRWLLGGAVLVVLVAGRSCGNLQPNELRVLADAPRADFWVEQEHRRRPPAHVTTNRLGFRDRDVAPTPASGVVRVAVVGDSFVYGLGIPEAEGLVTRQLERALGAAAPGTSFEVLSVAQPAWGYFTFFEVARRVLRELRPRVIVLGSRGAPDWDLLDFQQQAGVVGPHVFAVLHALGAAEDLKLASARYWGEISSDDAAFARAAGAARLRQLAADLLADAERRGCDVVVWEYYQPFAFLRDFEGRPRFHLAGWPAGFDRRVEGWGRDPRLAIPDDGHPTPAANTLVAEALAPVVLRLVGQAPTPAASRAVPASAPASAPAAPPPP